MLNIFVTAILGFVAWIAMSIMDLKTETAVINQKVSENHKMLTVLWDDFLRKKWRSRVGHSQTKYPSPHKNESGVKNVRQK